MNKKQEDFSCFLKQTENKIIPGTELIGQGAFKKVINVQNNPNLVILIMNSNDKNEFILMKKIYDDFLSDKNPNKILISNLIRNFQRGDNLIHAIKYVQIGGFEVIIK